MAKHLISIVFLLLLGLASPHAVAYEQSSIGEECLEYGAFDQAVAKEQILKDWYHYLVDEYYCQPIANYFLKLLLMDESLETQLKQARLSMTQIKEFYSSLEFLQSIDWQSENLDFQTALQVEEKVRQVNNTLKRVMSRFSPGQLDDFREQILIGIPSEFA